MEIRGSARKHNIADNDIAHAWAPAIRIVEYEYHGEERLLIIGLTDTVTTPADTTT